MIEIKCESFNTCEYCGQPLGADGYCYNNDCQAYDPLSQYFDEHIQSEWFDYFLDIEDNTDIDPDLWNNMSREERFDYVMPMCREFMDKYGSKMSDIDWEDFIYDLEDNNFHTEVRAFKTLMND